MCLYLALLGLCWVGFSLVAVSRSYALTAAWGLLIAVACLVAEHGALGHVGSVMVVCL